MQGLVMTLPGATCGMQGRAGAQVGQVVAPGSGGFQHPLAIAVAILLGAGVQRLVKEHLKGGMAHEWKLWVLLTVTAWEDLASGGGL